MEEHSGIENKVYPRIQENIRMLQYNVVFIFQTCTYLFIRSAICICVTLLIADVCLTFTVLQLLQINDKTDLTLNLHTNHPIAAQKSCIFVFPKGQCRSSTYWHSFDVHNFWRSFWPKSLLKRPWRTWCEPIDWLRYRTLWIACWWSGSPPGDSVLLTPACAIINLLGKLMIIMSLLFLGLFLQMN